MGNSSVALPISVSPKRNSSPSLMFPSPSGGTRRYGWGANGTPLNLLDPGGGAVSNRYG
ncbi:MAG: hypothetical protein V2A76_15115 [Planctomycetota bacterium]